MFHFFGTKLLRLRGWGRVWSRGHTERGTSFALWLSSSVSRNLLKVCSNFGLWGLVGWRAVVMATRAFQRIENTSEKQL